MRLRGRSVDRVFQGERVSMKKTQRCREAKCICGIKKVQRGWKPPGCLPCLVHWSGGWPIQPGSLKAPILLPSTDFHFCDSPFPLPLSFPDNDNGIIIFTFEIFFFFFTTQLLQHANKISSRRENIYRNTYWHQHSVSVTVLMK